MEAHLDRLRSDGLAPVLLGDYNIAHQPIDLARPESNHENPGYLPQEREWMTRYLSLGFRDSFREANPDVVGAYTWWTYRGGARPGMLAGALITPQSPMNWPIRSPAWPFIRTSPAQIIAR